jgi:hypothetical protein
MESDIDPASISIAIQRGSKPPVLPGAERTGKMPFHIAEAG